VLALAGTACDSNVEACQSYVTKVNTERTTCGETELLDANTECPAFLDDGDTSCTEYYDCLAERSQCLEGAMVYDIAGCPGCI